jgi:chorismate-pyruvate lyase
MPPHSRPDLGTLIGIFFQQSEQLGEFREVEADEMPEVDRSLLSHDHHMTVTVESFHASLVNVDVLTTDISGDHYARKILLRRQSDDQVVQFGIMRLDLGFLEPEVRAEILSQQTPLGRILIEHDVLREVQLVALWKIQAGPDLADYFGIAQQAEVYGRTALIYCNGEPVVELLEIITPAADGH